MSYKQQYFEWDVQLSQVPLGEAVGYEVEFSKNPSGKPVICRLSTFKEVTSELQGIFFYSLDNGSTWTDFPLGEDGCVFNTAYKMRVKVSSVNISYIVAARDAVIYKISSDGRSIISSFEVNEPVDSDIFEINDKKNVVCLTDGNTMYRLDVQNNKMLPYSNSINLIHTPFDIAIDSSRDSFWQISQTNICLKSFSGDTIFCVDLLGLGELYTVKGIGYGKIGIDLGVA